MSTELPPERLNVYVKDPHGNWEVAMYYNGVWTKGVDDSPDDVELDYTPIEWKFM